MSRFVRRAALVAAIVLGCSTEKQQQPVAVNGSISGSARFANASAHGGIHVAVRGTDHVAVTGDAGDFLIENVAAGSYTLEAASPGYVTATSPVQVAAGDRTSATLVIAPVVAGTATVSGTVQLADGGDAAGSTVLFDGTSAVAFAGAGGAFFFDAVPPGSYSLEIRRPGYVTLQQTVTVAAPATQLGAFALSPEPAAAGSIAGTVTRNGAANGNGGILVAVLGTSSSATTADDGSFRIDGIAPGTFSVQLTAAGFDSQLLTGVRVDAGATTPIATALLPAAVAAAGTVQGRITRAGAASGNGGVAVFLEGTTILANTSDDGFFTLANVPPGSYVLAASAPGFAFAEAPGVQVLDGQVTQVEQIDLQPPAGPPAPTGTVQGFAGALGASDESGVSVELIAADGSTMASTGTSTSGAYLLSDIPVGIYTLQLTLPGYTSAQLSNVAVLPGTYEAPPVALYPGLLVRAGGASQGSPLTATKLQLLTADGDLIYDWQADTLATPSIPGVRFSPLNLSTDQTSALVALDSTTVARLDLASGAVTPLTKVNNVYPGIYAGRTLYTDNFFQLHVLGPDDRTAPPVVNLGCTPTSNPTLVPLVQNGPLEANWVRLEPSNCIGFPSFTNVLLNLVTGQLTPPGDLLGIVDDGSAALMLTADLGAGRDLVRVDFATGAQQLLRHEALTSFGTPDYVPVWSNPDVNGLGTVSKLNLHDGSVVDLLSAAPQPPDSLQLPNAVLQGGTPLSFNVVRFDAASSVALCPAANSTISQLFTSTVVCATGAAAPFTLRSYFPGTNLLQTLSNAASNQFVTVAATHTLTWQESGGPRVARIDLPAVVVSLCNGPFVLSADESTGATVCGQTYAAYDLIHGGSRTLTTLGSGRFPASPLLSSTGRLLLSGFSASSGADPCGLTCGLVIDTVTLGQTVFSAPVSSVFVGGLSSAPQDSAVFYSPGFRSFVIVKPGAGAPAVDIRGGISTSVSVWGSTGACAVLSNGWLFNTVTGDVTTTTSSFTQIGATDDWLSGDSVLDLAACKIIPLGSAISVIRRTATGLTYRDGATRELRTFSPAAGIATVATSTQLIQSFVDPGVFTFLLSGGTDSGDLYDVLADGSVHLLLRSSAPQIGSQQGRFRIGFANPDAQTADAVVLDLTAQTAVSTGARVRLNTFSFASIGDRFVFNGTVSGDPASHLLSVNFDGSGLRVIGPPSTNLNLVFGSRVGYLAADGLDRVENPHGEALALDQAFTLIAVAPDGASILVNGSAKHPGLWRVALP